MSKFGDDDRRGRGPGKPYGAAGGGKPWGGPRPGGGSAWRPREEGSGDRPRGPKVERFGRDEGDRKPFQRREGAEGERRPFQRREGGEGERRPFQRREGGEGERRPFQRREGGEGERRPFQRREGGEGERRPFQRREGGEGERRPFQRREGGEGERRPFQRREGGEGERRPFQRREGGEGERRPFQRRDDGERAPKRPFADRGYESLRSSYAGTERPKRKFSDRARKPDDRAAPREGAAGNDELRQYGWNACLATYQHRPEAVRKVYLHTSRIDAMREMLQDLADRQIGYRVVENEDLEKLTQTQHHEGVCFDVIPPAMLSLDQVLGQAETAGAAWFVWLDGVGNPHNLGAILRSAAHFGCAGVLVHRDANLKLSGAAVRVAEGGAECVPLVRIGDTRGAVEKLRGAGFKLLATSVRDGDSLFETELPSKLVWLMGAEGEGVSSGMQDLADSLVRIPGTGRIESLNVAAAFAVFAAETHRTQR